MLTGVDDIDKLLGEQAWRIDISHVSSKCDNENSDGIFDMRETNVFWHVLKKGVTLNSCSSKLQLGDVDG